ncbi:MAG: isoprenylcysteine carboxylmethyltransferase family protein [Bacteroidales bacterium]
MKTNLKSPIGLNPLGIGPKIMKPALPFILIAILAGFWFPEIFSFRVKNEYLLVAGIILLSMGIIAYIATLAKFVKEFPHGKLITTGTFAVSRNPLYASWIIFILPSLVALTNNWLWFLPAFAMYIAFILNIKEEENALKEIFGTEYQEYCKKVNRLFGFSCTKKC